MCASNCIASVWTGPFSILTRQCLCVWGSKRNDDSVSVEELDWSAESQVLIPAEHLWCDFKCRTWAKREGREWPNTFGNIVYTYVHITYCLFHYTLIHNYIHIRCNGSAEGSLQNVASCSTGLCNGLHTQTHTHSCLLCASDLWSGQSLCKPWVTELVVSSPGEHEGLCQ